MAVALILSDHNRCVKSLTTYLESVGWCLSSTDTSFPAHGDTISGSCLIITVNHSLCASMVEPLHLKSLPPSAPHPLGLLIWEPFNQPEHSVLLAKGDDDVMCQDVQFTATLPKPSLIIPPGVLVKYFLHGWNSEEFKQAGAAVVSRDDLCPPFVATPPQKNTLVWDQIPLWKSFSHPRHLTIRICSLLWIQWRPDLSAVSTSK